MLKQHLLKIQDIEKSVYPEYMQYLVGCRNTKDLANYMECKPREIYYELGEDYYLLAAEKKDFIEIVDIATTKPKNLLRIINQLTKRWSGRKIIMDARASTSYPIIILICKRKGLEILKDETWDWGNDEMHYLEIML